MTLALKHAFNQGKKDFQRGWTEGHNPYSVRAFQKAWMKGFKREKGRVWLATNKPSGMYLAGFSEAGQAIWKLFKSKGEKGQEGLTRRPDSHLGAVCE